LPRLHLTRRKIDPALALSKVARAGAGGLVLFVGAVRDNSEFGEVDMVEYEAYEPMAEKRLQLIEKSTMQLWPGSRVFLVHRLGRLKVGAVSVVVAASAPHRAEAFEACRYSIEMIKRDVPIWKKERLSDGTAKWVGGSKLGPIRARRRNG